MSTPAAVAALAAHPKEGPNSIHAAVVTLTPMVLDAHGGGSVSSISPVTITVTPEQLTVLGGAVSPSISRVTLTLTPVSLVAVPGTVSKTITPVTLTTTPVALTSSVGGTTASISPVTITVTPVSLGATTSTPIKLYLRSTAASTYPSDGEKSSVLPVGSFKGTSVSADQRKSLIPSTPGSACVIIPLGSIGQTAHQDNYFGRFNSAPLAAQTFGEGEWTFAWAGSATAAANLRSTLSLYIWNPSGGSVRGYIYDSDTTLGSMWGTGGAIGRVATFNGSNVSVSAGDILVAEIWTHATQTDAYTHSSSFWYNGPTDPTEDSNNSTFTASYLRSPSTPVFQ